MNNHDIIRQSILKYWDPVGVVNIPEAQDEYDAYIPKLESLIINSSDIKVLFDYLWLIETDYMGISGNKDFTLNYAKKCYDLKKQLVIG